MNLLQLERNNITGVGGNVAWVEGQASLPHHDQMFRLDVK
jgi:hypothetical protein